VVLALALLLLGGCGSTIRELHVHPTARANQGRPFYLMVRTATEKDFFTDHYQKVAGMVFPVSEDPSILATALVWPGHGQKLKVKVPAKKSFGVYVLYTNPGDPWKLLLAPPLKDEYHFVLDDARIVQRRPQEKP
jgi:hypothetical protein